MSYDILVDVIQRLENLKHQGVKIDPSYNKALSDAIHEVRVMQQSQSAAAVTP